MKIHESMEFLVSSQSSSELACQTARGVYITYRSLVLGDGPQHAPTLDSAPGTARLLLLLLQPLWGDAAIRRPSCTPPPLVEYPWTAHPQSVPQSVAPIPTGVCTECSSPKSRHESTVGPAEYPGVPIPRTQHRVSWRAHSSHLAPRRVPFEITLQSIPCGVHTDHTAEHLLRPSGEELAAYRQSILAAPTQGYPVWRACTQQTPQHSIPGVSTSPTFVPKIGMFEATNLLLGGRSFDCPQRKLERCSPEFLRTCMLPEWLKRQWPRDF